jgi:hypothetical protein
MSTFRQQAALPAEHNKELRQPSNAVAPGRRGRGGQVLAAPFPRRRAAAPVGAARAEVCA